MAAIRLSASFVLVREQSVVKYSGYEASRDAVSASASPGVNSKMFTSFTRTLATLPLLLIVPSGSELYFLSQSLRPFPLCATVGSVRTLGNYGRSDGRFASDGSPELAFEYTRRRPTNRS